MSLSIQSLLRSATQRLQHDEASLEASLLLQHVLQVNRAWLIAHADEELAAQHEVHFERLLERRMKGEPIAYILGQREFYGLTLRVTPDTLIPRPDTEIVVEVALERLREQRRQSKEALRILDMGTGSGAIALALAKQLPEITVWALDASAQALAVARNNAETHRLSNVHCVHSDWFKAIPNERYHLIVSNPPYIEDDDHHLNEGDLRFEPRTALASGEDGLQDMRTIVAQAPDHLHQNGWLLLEHGYNQASAVSELLAKAGFSAIRHAKDLAGIERVTYGQWHP